MSYTVATLPKGFAIAFDTKDLDKVIKTHGYMQLMNIEQKDGWEEAVFEMERRNEEIERKRNSSLLIVSQGLHSIVNVHGDMNQVLASLTKFICETMSKGEFTFAQIDCMIDLVMNHMDNLAELQTKTFRDLKDVLDDDPILQEEDCDEYWDEEEDLNELL